MTLAPTATDVHYGQVANAPRPGETFRRASWRAVPVKSASPQLHPLPPHGAARRGSYRPMTTADEVSFAWALTGVTRGLFTSQEQAWICITLGAGDSTRIVEHLLGAIARHGSFLPDDLADYAFDWFVGFLGTDKEQGLRALVERVRPSALISPRVDGSSRAQGHAPGIPTG